jgi:hypothetical protein
MMAKMKKMTRVNENIDITEGMVRNKVPNNNLSPGIRGINLVARSPLMILIFGAAVYATKVVGYGI